MPLTTISRRPRPPAMPRSVSTTSVAIELDQPLVADPEVMRDLVEHDVPGEPPAFGDWCAFPLPTRGRSEKGRTGPVPTASYRRYFGRADRT
jgi:hypothetical protein